MDVEVTAKRWGNSIGIIVPRRVVKELGLQEGNTVTASFKRSGKTVLEEAWESGLLRNTGRTTREIIDQYRKENPFSTWMS